MIFIFCRNCGNKIENSGSFCAQCGIEIEKLDTHGSKSLWDKLKQRPTTAALICAFIVVISGTVTYVMSLRENNDNTLDNKDKKSEVVSNTKEKNTKKDDTKDNTKNNKENKLDEDNEIKEKTDSTNKNISPSLNEISTEDLKELSKADVELLRNEIYARHGYIFKEKKFEEYFLSTEWYVPNNQFNEGMFSDIERKNLAAIIKYEKERGWR